MVLGGDFNPGSGGKQLRCDKAGTVRSLYAELVERIERRPDSEDECEEQGSQRDTEVSECSYEEESR